MTDLSRLTAALADRYRIEREIGAGGMATVYLAHDVKHDRKVAVKVLRPELAHVIGPERFLAEIKTTAHLQHPYILGLIDSGEVNGTVFYVMPFVRGESLKERLEREQQLPIADAVRIATQVASALDYAHRQGVIHRDIKPANILLHDEQALVADFGIALAASRPGSTKRMTDTGMSLGTPHYMSPEQAMGERTLDARTDIYALGCVLYEMLTGEPPFDGPNGQAIIAKVMSVDPEPVTTVRKSVPHNVAAATMMALSKLPADRFASAATFSAALANPQFTGPRTHAKVSTADAFVVRRAYVGGAAAIAMAILAAVLWLPRSGTLPDGSIVARFEIPIPDSLFAPQFTMSHDGSRLVWSTPGGFWERSLDSLSIRRVREAPPTFASVRDLSPDGREALVTTGRGGGVGIAPLAGGNVRPLTSSGRGNASWGADGYVYISTGGGGGPGGRGGARGIARVSVADGHVDSLARIADTTMNVSELVALPSGRGVIVVLSRAGSTLDSIVALDVGSKRWIPLAAGGANVRYVEPGYLLYTNGQSLMAAPFDAKKLAFTAPAQPFLELPAGGISSLSAGAHALVYLPAPEQGNSGIVIRSRAGVVRTLPNIPDTIRFSSFAVSPDGKRFAAAGGGQQPFGGGRGGPGGPGGNASNIWIYTLPSGPMSRLPSDDRDVSPAWIPGSSDISFTRATSDSSMLMRRRWDNSGAPPVRLFTRPGGRGGGSIGQIAWLPGGRQAILRVSQGRGGGPDDGRGGPAADSGRGGRGGDGRQGGGRGAFGGGGRGAPGDLVLFSLDAPSRLEPVVATPASETNPAVSADGSMLAYTSDESDRGEVYVQRRAGGLRHQVSLAGGRDPRWSHAGSELFFVSGDTLFSAQIHPGADLDVGEVKPVFAARSINNGYAVLPGDSAFVMLPVPASSNLVVVVNYVRELERLFAKRD